MEGRIQTSQSNQSGESEHTYRRQETGTTSSLSSFLSLCGIFQDGSPQENPNEPKQSPESKKLFLPHVSLFFSSELYNVCREVVDNHDIIMEQGELVNEPKPVDDHPWAESMLFKIVVVYFVYNRAVQLACYNTAGIVSLDSADASLDHQTRLANRKVK